MPNGGLAVVAAGGKVFVYRSITTSSPVLVTTLTASNYVSYSSSATQNYQSSVFINKDYIVLENLGRTTGSQNENSQNGANTYAIDFFDLNNSYARTTHMPGFKIGAGFSYLSQYVETMGISADSKTYIPSGNDMTALPTGGGGNTQRIKYKDQRP